MFIDVRSLLPRRGIVRREQRHGTVRMICRQSLQCLVCCRCIICEEVNIYTCIYIHVYIIYINALYVCDLV